MPTPPSNDNASNLPPLYQIPRRVSARTVSGDSDSDEDFWSDDSEAYVEGSSTNQSSDLGPHEPGHITNSTGPPKPRPVLHDSHGRWLQSSRPRPHAGHQQTEPRLQHHLPSSTAAPARRPSYEDGPRRDHAYSSVGDAWYPYGSNPYRGEHVVPYRNNYNAFTAPPGPPPGPSHPMQPGPVPPMMQHPINSGPSMYPGHGMPLPSPGGYSYMDPHYPTQHPNRHPNQYTNHNQMPPPYPNYPSIDGSAPPPMFPQPRVNIRRSSMRHEPAHPRPSPPSPYIEPQRTRGRRDSIPREYHGLHQRPQPSRGQRPRNHRPSVTERLDSDEDVPRLSKENLEKLDQAKAYMRAADEGGVRSDEQARENEVRLEPKKDQENEAPKTQEQKSTETKDEKNTAVAETRIKNIEYSLQQLVTTLQGTALQTTTAAGLPGVAAQDAFRTLRDLESRQLMQQVSGLLQTLSGSLGAGFAPPAVPMSPLGGYTPLINLQQLGALLRPQFTSAPGHPLNINQDELTAAYVQQLQQRIERLERDRDTSTTSKAEPANHQQQASAGDTKTLSPLEYLKVLNEGMHHLNARLGASQEQDHIRDAEEVASTTTDGSGRRQRQRRSTTRETVPDDAAPAATESRPGIMKPSHCRSASRASSTSKKARFEDDISEEEDEEDIANYTHKPRRSSSSKGQVPTAPPSNMNIKATRRGSGSGGVNSSSESYPPQREDLFYDSDDGTAESRGLKRRPMVYAKKGYDISESTWKPVVPDPPPSADI